MSKVWGYTELNGPHVWKEMYPQAAGQRQSPVDIRTRQTTQSSDLSSNPLRWTYVPENTRSLVNPGYCWRVDVEGKGSQLTGGPLGDEIFILEQFHSHWGCSDSRGSEHTVDGEAFAGELHLVHWNQTKYRSFAEAAGQPDGLAVLGVFLKVGKPHPEMDTIAKLLPFITHKGDRVTMPKPLDPANLLPASKAYWTYLGSLTTPPCSESVTWILFQEPIEVSHEQLEHFREMRCYDAREECPCDDSLHKTFEYGSHIEEGQPANNIPLKPTPALVFGGSADKVALPLVRQKHAKGRKKPPHPTGGKLQAERNNQAANRRLQPEGDGRKQSRRENGKQMRCILDSFG